MKYRLIVELNVESKKVIRAGPETDDGQWTNVSRLVSRRIVLQRRPSLRGSDCNRGVSNVAALS